MKFLLASALAFCILGAGFSFADPSCNVPLTEWQPRDALRKKVEAEGWKVTRIKTDEGCYEVRGINDKGDRYEGKFDPRTLKVLKVEIDYK
jgi:hypothetical protein